MKKAEYAKYLQSEHWLTIRKSFIEQADHRCERCYFPRWLSKWVYGEDLHVHHRNYACLGSESPDDVEVLCKRCHEIETFGRSDQPEVKKATCIFCGDEHFNVYADLCDPCRLIQSMDYPLSTILHVKDPYSDRQMWQLLLEEVTTFLEWKLNPKKQSAGDSDVF